MSYPYVFGGLCYGGRTLVSLVEVGRPFDTGCGIIRRVSFLYYHGGFPDWADHPLVRAAYPEALRARDENVVRHDWMWLARAGGGWTRTEYDPIHSSCVPPSR